MPLILDQKTSPCSPADPQGRRFLSACLTVGRGGSVVGKRNTETGSVVAGLNKTSERSNQVNDPRLEGGGLQQGERLCGKPDIDQTQA